MRSMEAGSLILEFPALDAVNVIPQSWTMRFLAEPQRGEESVMPNENCVMLYMLICDGRNNVGVQLRTIKRKVQHTVLLL
jgi:hypothetical protein